jgi:hypothetical protein
LAEFRGLHVSAFSIRPLIGGGESGLRALADDLALTFVEAAV